MDMRFYWLIDRNKKQQFHVNWKPAKDNMADYVSKHHPTKYHIQVRSTYVANNLQQLKKDSYLRDTARVSSLPRRTGNVIQPVPQKITNTIEHNKK